MYKVMTVGDNYMHKRCEQASDRFNSYESSIYTNQIICLGKSTK